MMNVRDIIGCSAEDIADAARLRVDNVLDTMVWVKVDIIFWGATVNTVVLPVKDALFKEAGR